MLVPILAVCLALVVPAHATFITTEREWLAFDDAAECPVRFETKIPAESGFTNGPDGRSAIRVAVPDIERDEQACAFAIALPPLGEAFNAARLWLKGSENTKRLEVVFRTDSGSFGTDVLLEPEWRTVTFGPHNTRPFFGTEQGALDASRATEIRFCFGVWQGHRGGPHEVSIGPITALQSPLLAPGGPVETVNQPELGLPLQSFTVELLDLCRGQWRFRDPLGGRLDLEGPVSAFAFVGNAGGRVRLGYLCCDPEFPDDLRHADLRIASPLSESAEDLLFKVEEACFACGVAARALGDGVYQCELHDIQLGPATTGDRYVAGMYLLVGTRASPLWLAGGRGAEGPHCRLLTDRVGSVFAEDEPVRITLVGWHLQGELSQRISLRATDYASGEALWRDRVRLQSNRGELLRREVEVPVDRFGVFEVTAFVGADELANLRVCRIPRPRRIDPDRSAIGINVFQQQIWWYAYQVPLMAKAGVHWLRPWLAWENTWRTQEPEPGQWDTRALDAALRRMEAHGQRYECMLFSAPNWVAGSARSGVPPAERMDEWAEYVERLVRQYKGRLTHYEVWNEPDLMWPAETRLAGEHYLAMLKATWEAAKRADPDCVIDGLSQAGNEQWLENVGRLGAGEYLDVATVHTYAGPADFAGEIEKRRRIIRQHGMGEKTLWINEFGGTAYDFSPEYSARFGCSERKQAGVLVANYAQALSFDPGMKAFWFCTYDPRDAASESQWTWDAGIGVLYLGFLPKLSYAALAGVARQLDGRKCLGRADIARDLHQVSFEGPVAVVWHDRPDRPIAATELGCLPGEQIVVRDMFTNELASGKAGETQLDFARGVLYIEGSRQMAGLARAESGTRVEPETLALAPGEAGEMTVTAPQRARIHVEPETRLPASVEALEGRVGERARIVVTAPPDCERGSGVIVVRVTLSRGMLGLLEPAEIRRTATVTVGEPNLIRDGAFALGHLLEWAPERTSAYTWDSEVGHRVPGSLRFDGPFDRRLVHWRVTPETGRPVRLRLWVKAQELADCVASVNLALFGPDKWITTWCLAATEDEEQGRFDGTASIPAGTTDWTLVETELPAELV